MAEFINLRAEKHYKVRRGADNRDFKSLYRFEEENLHYIATHFMGENNERRGGALSSDLKIKIFLRYMTNPGFQTGVAEELGIHQSTVSKTITFVINKILEKAPLWIKFPSTLNQVNEAQERWQETFQFPCAIGVIDCTHVQILKPIHHGDEYINRKGLATLNVQATCNSKEIFTSVDASWPGSVHDARIWRNSETRLIMQQFPGAILLGDDGYGLEPWLMTPFRNPNNESERTYNRLFKKEKVIIERCFGQLKRRFPILKYMCRVKLERVPSVIVCCIVLHNIAKYLGDADFPDDDDEENLNNGEEYELEEDRLLQRARERRLEIADVIFTQNLR
ncbi:putative nuclease HARBI1 [Onthophagus taurus]|uniref:putative nuclease HARBI1 n=1 Tax=Onthophagus taurus TaxID=166361 RepID=UPI0039BEBF13